MTSLTNSALCSSTTCDKALRPCGQTFEAPSSVQQRSICAARTGTARVDAAVNRFAHCRYWSPPLFLAPMYKSTPLFTSPCAFSVDTNRRLSSLRHLRIDSCVHVAMRLLCASGALKSHLLPFATPRLEVSVESLDVEGEGSA